MAPPNKELLDEVNRRLKQNGCDIILMEDGAKLQEIWRLLTCTEAELAIAKRRVTEAERQHAGEMKEVETYMDQIRHLSDEREVLTADFEMENEHLKNDLQMLREEAASVKREVAQMLIQEGLMDLVDGTPSETIAYLLVERKRTIDELRDAKRRSASSPGVAITTSKQMLDVLAKERTLMEEEIKIERGNARKMKENIEQDSKLRIANLESQKKRLEHEARQHTQTTRDLQFDVEQLKKTLERERSERVREIGRLQQHEQNSSKDLGQPEMSQLREAKKKLETDLSAVKYRYKTAEEDKDKLNQRVKELTESLDAEKKRRSSYEGTIIKLKAVVDKNKKLITSLENEKQTLSDHKAALEVRLGFLEKDLDELKEQKKSLLNQTNSNKPEQTTNDRGEIKSLRLENHGQSLKLKRAMVSLDAEKRKCLELEQKLTSTEGKWEQIVQRYKDSEKSLTSKLDKLTRDLELSKSELDANHHRISRIHQEHELKLTDCKLEAERLNKQLLAERRVVESAERHRAAVKEMETVTGELRKDRDALARELQAMMVKEQQHRELSKTAQGTVEENRRLAKQLETSVLKQSSLVEELSEERRKNLKLQDRLNTSQETLKLAEESTGHLKENLGRKSAELVRQYDWSKEGQIKLENKLRSLEADRDQLRMASQRDETEIAWRLEREEKRVKELEGKLDEKRQELAELRREIARIMADQARAEGRIQDEARLRVDIEHRNKLLEEEMTKQWGQLKDLMTKLSTAESAKQELEVQLEKQTNETRQRYNEITQVEAQTNATTNTLSLVQQRAQHAERKIPELQQQLDEKSLRLQSAEAQLRDLSATKLDLRASKDDMNRLKAQLSQERIEKSLLVQQLEDLKLQVSAALDREDKLNHEHADMKHRLLDTQSKLYNLEDRTKSVGEMHSLAEQGKKSLFDQVSSLQSDTQRLKTDLVQTAQRLETQLTRYDECKAHHKTKLQQAREIFTRHKSVLADSLAKLQQDLNTTNAELQKEQNNRDNLQKKHDSLLAEHRKLLATLSDTEEAVRDQNRNVNTKDYRVKYLERENGILQDRIDALSRQRVAMEKLIREYRLEKQKLEIDRSVLAMPTMGGFTTSPSSTLNNHPTATLTSGLGWSHSPSYLSTLDPSGTISSATKLTSTPSGIQTSPVMTRHSSPPLHSPRLTHPASSDNDTDS